MTQISPRAQLPPGALALPWHSIWGSSSAASKAKKSGLSWARGLCEASCTQEMPEQCVLAMDPGQRGMSCCQLRFARESRASCSKGERFPLPFGEMGAGRAQRQRPASSVHELFFTSHDFIETRVERTFGESSGSGCTF